MARACIGAAADATWLLTHAGTGWLDAECNDAAAEYRGVCAMECAEQFTVSLPAGAGSVQPPNAATYTPVIVQYTPPSVFVSRAPQQAAVTNIPALRFSANFSRDVTGLTASDFVVSTVRTNCSECDADFRASLVGDGVPGDPGVIVARSLSGSGVSYTLTLALSNAQAANVLVLVSLPAGVGSVSPPNLASEAPAAAVDYTPPVPRIYLSSGQSVTTPWNVVEFDVAFTSPVSGLAASDFTVKTSAVGVATAALLAGSGSEYALSVTVDVGTVPGGRCPTGYMFSPTAWWCARVVDVPGTWAAANAACAPYSLSTVASAEKQAFLASVVPSPDNAYWCV